MTRLVELVQSSIGLQMKERFDKLKHTEKVKEADSYANKLISNSTFAMNEGERCYRSEEYYNVIKEVLSFASTKKNIRKKATQIISSQIEQIEYRNSKYVWMNRNRITSECTIIGGNPIIIDDMNRPFTDEELAVILKEN